VAPLRLCLTLLIVSSLLALCAIPMGGFDTDYWWHLAAGRYMAQSGQILTHDVFSHTRFEAEWDNRDWLFQAIVYATYQWGGLNAGLGIRIAFVLLAVGVLARTARRRGADPYATGLAVFWAGSLAANYPHVRPYFISLFCGSIMAFALASLQRDPDPRRNKGSAFTLWGSLWFWSNNHGGVSLVGLDMVCVTALVGVWSQPGQWKCWLGLVLGSVLALMAVPQPLETLSFVFHMTVGNNPYKRMMVEFFPPNFLAPHERPYGLFLLVFVLGAVYRALRQRQPLDLLLFLSFSPLLFSGGRHQFLLIPLLSPGMATMLSDLGAFVRRRLPQPGARTVQLGTLCLCLGCLVLSARELTLACRRGWPPRRLISWDQLPEGACRWLQAQNIQGKMFNDMPWGGYLMWRLGPQSKVFMDARNEVYGYGQVLQDFLSILRRGDALSLKLLDQYQVDFAVLESGPNPLGQLLARSPGWAQVYDDGVGAVYLRADQQRPWVATHPYWTELWKGAARLPREGAVAALQEALQRYPDGQAMRVQLGALLASSQPERAEREWRLALVPGPVPLAHYNLGLLARQRGDYLRSSCEFRREWELYGSASAALALEQLPPVPRPYYWAFWGWHDFWAPWTWW
jgi:hypothetical protein